MTDLEPVDKVFGPRKMDPQPQPARSKAPGGKTGRTRRRVTNAYKLKLIEEWRNAIDPEARAAMFARERISPSTLRNWRKQESELRALVNGPTVPTSPQSNDELIKYRLVVELIERLLIERDGEDSELAALVSSLRQVAL